MTMFYILIICLVQVQYINGMLSKETNLTSV